MQDLVPSVPDHPLAEMLGSAVVVRDLADGAAVSDEIAMEVLQPAGSAESKDPPMAEDPLAPLSLAKPREEKSQRWHGALQSSEEVAETGVLWAYRTITLHGTIRLEDPLPGSGATISLRLIPRVDPSDASPSPSTESWLREHGFPRWPIDLKAPDPRPDGGTVTVDIPRIDGLYLSVDAVGYRPQWFPVQTAGEDWTLEVFLKKSFEVSGTLTDPDGKPLAGQRVRAFIVKRGGYDSFGPNLILQQPAGGIAGSRHKGLDASISWQSTSILTGIDGAFSIPLKGDGEVFLYAYPEGLPIVESKLGGVGTDYRDVQLQASRPAGTQWVTITYGGKVAAEKKVMVIDLSGIPQVSYSVATSAEGKISGYWLGVGRQYKLVVDNLEDLGGSGSEYRFGVWSGEAQIELTEWERRPPDIRLLEQR